MRCNIFVTHSDLCNSYHQQYLGAGDPQYIYTTDSLYNLYQRCKNIRNEVKTDFLNLALMCTSIKFLHDFANDCIF